ncbi:MAG: hypothetical protein XE08_0047 [Parcubacteria bacterium 32_520]|nr:MAG: hypothetical protein XE08_0047 [Parcubacteria bacterium 32_520]
MELLINGKFTDQELNELKEEFREQNITVDRYFTKGIEAEEIIRVLLRDFDLYTFLRDGILFTSLASICKKTIEWIKNKKKDSNIQIEAQLGFKIKDKEIVINLSIPFKNEENFWKELKNVLTIGFVMNVKEGEIVFITWDIENQKIRIFRF